MLFRTGRFVWQVCRPRPWGGIDDEHSCRFVCHHAALCPLEMKKIDDALAKNPPLTAAQLADVKKYRAEGETLHKEGKHQESLDALAKAEKILGIPTN